MTRFDNRYVLCLSCQNDQGRPHTCDVPDHCPCGQYLLHKGALPEPLTAPLPVAQPTGGTQPHPRTREPLSAFQWPCDIHNAHGAHGDDAHPATRDGERIGHCPGVGAYPTTMIGGGYRDGLD